MKSLSLARVLPVLESFESQRRPFDRPEPFLQEAVRPELHVVESAPSWEADSVEDAAAHDQRIWQDGYEAGVSVGRAQAEAQARDPDALLHDAIAAARADWLGQESERIAQGVERALACLQDEICTVAARVLAQITDELMRERAIADFSKNVAALLRDGEAGVVTLHAPEDLIATLEARLGALGTLEFIAHDSAEVWVRCGATMIETRFEAWRSDHFSKA